jgi:hypothetical protein
VRLADLFHRVDELSHAAVLPFWSRGCPPTILGNGPAPPRAAAVPR